MNRFEPPPLPGQDRPADPGNPYATPTDAGRTDRTRGYPAQGYPSVPYGTAPQAPWGPAASYAHPRGTTVLVLGILSVVLIPLLGPVAWVMGRNALQEVDAAPHATSNRSTLQAGTVLGIIGTVFMVLGLLWFVAAIGFILMAGVATG